MKNFHLVRVGTVDWAHPAWRGRFYPEDLPEDWMLSFYNTQWLAVYLPCSTWSGVPQETWSQWLLETGDDFHFLLEPGDRGLASPASDRVFLATPGWCGAHLWWLDESFDLRALSRCIGEHASSGEPLYIISRSGDLGKLQAANDLRQVMGY
jgi:hypothetical protein